MRQTVIWAAPDLNWKVARRKIGRTVISLHTYLLLLLWFFIYPRCYNYIHTNAHICFVLFFCSRQKYNWQFWYQIPTMLPPYCCLNVDAERLPIDCRLFTGIQTLLNLRTEGFKEELPPDNSDRRIIIFEVDMDPKRKRWFSYYTIIPILYIFFPNTLIYRYLSIECW